MKKKIEFILCHVEVYLVHLLLQRVVYHDSSASQTYDEDMFKIKTVVFYQG